MPPFGNPGGGGIPWPQAGGEGFFSIPGLLWSAQLPMVVPSVPGPGPTVHAALDHVVLPGSGTSSSSILTRPLWVWSKDLPLGSRVQQEAGTSASLGLGYSQVDASPRAADSGATTTHWAAGLEGVMHPGRGPGKKCLCENLEGTLLLQAGPWPQAAWLPGGHCSLLQEGSGPVGWVQPWHTVAGSH